MFKKTFNLRKFSFLDLFENFYFCHILLSFISYFLFLGRKNFFFVNKKNNILIDHKNKKIIHKIDNIRFGHRIYEMQLASYYAKKFNYELLYFSDPKSLHHFFFTLECDIKKNNISNKKLIKKKYIFIFYVLENIYKFKYSFLRYNFIKPTYYREINKFRFRSRRDRNNYFVSNSFKVNLNYKFTKNQEDGFKKFLDEKKINKPIITLALRNDIFVTSLLKKYRDQNVELTKKKKKIKMLDSTRNSGSNYFVDLIKEFEDKYFFIKIGFQDHDTNLDKFKFKNYYDLSNSKNWSEELQAILIDKSFFGIFPDTGLLLMAISFNRPKLLINGVHPLINNIFPNTYTILKRIYDEKNNLIGKDVEFDMNNLKTNMNPNYRYENISVEDFMKVTKNILYNLENKNNEFNFDISENMKKKLKFIKTNIVANSNYMNKWLGSVNGIGHGKLSRINVEEFN